MQLWRSAIHFLCLSIFVSALWRLFVAFFICSFIVQDANAIVESQYDARIVGCSGGVGVKHLGLILHAKFELHWDNLVVIIYEHDVHTRELLESWHGDSLLMETTDALDWKWQTFLLTSILRCWLLFMLCMHPFSLLKRGTFIFLFIRLHNKLILNTCTLLHVHCCSTSTTCRGDWLPIRSAWRVLHKCCLIYSIICPPTP